MSEETFLIAPNDLIADLWTLQFPGIRVYSQNQRIVYTKEVQDVIQAEIDRLAARRKAAPTEELGEVGK